MAAPMSPHLDGLQPSLSELIALRERVRGWPPAQRGAASVAGPAPSPFRGRGMEYAESRPYAPGDDARHIDWRLTARSGKPHTKLFQAERERITLIVADTAPQLYFGTRVRFKSVQAARAGAVAAWAGQRRGDRIGALRGTSSEPPIMPGGGSRGALRTLDALVRWYAQPPAADLGLDHALATATRLLHPGASLIVLADAASLADVAQGRLAALAMHHDLLAVLLTDPLEMQPPRERLPFALGDARIEFDLDSPVARARWRHAFADEVQAQTRRLQGMGARVRLLRSDDGTDTLLAALLASVASPHDVLPTMTGSVPALRDIHLPPAPDWWPPAPGWWVLAALLLVALVWITRRLLRVRHRRRRIRNGLGDYDRALADAHEAPARLAAASLLLRRAARARDSATALLEGDAWLRFLDGDDPARPFTNGPGRLLRDGGFRREISDDIAPTLTLARARFRALLECDDA